MARVFLLISDSRPAGKSGGRVHYGPGFVDVADSLATEWISASLALDVRDGAVHQDGPTCSAHATDGRSCSLLEDHKGARHYDFSRTKDGENVGAGWWPREHEVKAEPTPEAAAPAPADPARERDTIAASDVGAVADVLGTEE